MTIATLESGAEECLPEGWVHVRLADVASGRKGKKPVKVGERAWPRSVPYIDIEAFDRGVVRRYADHASATIVDEGDIVVVWDGARSGLAGVVPRHGALGSTLVHVKPEGAEKRYLVHFLHSCYDTINLNTRGTGIPHVDPEVFWKLVLPLAPAAEQKRIVPKVEELLARVNAARERLARVPAILKRFRQSVLAAACSGRLTEEWREYRASPAFGEGAQSDLPEGWAQIDAGTAYLQADYGTSVRCHRNPSTGLPVLRVPNIAAGRLDFSDLKYAPRDAIGDLLLREADVLICRTNGSLDLVGKTAVVPDLGSPHSFASYLIRVALDPSHLLAAYYHLFLSSPLGRDQIVAEARTTAGQFNLNLRILRGLRLPLPPFAEQHEIVRRVEALFALADAIETRVAVATTRAEKLTQAILAKAFRGELVPTEAELAREEGRHYEPASALLERIRADRAFKAEDVQGRKAPRSETRRRART